MEVKMGKNQLWKDVVAGIGSFGEGFIKTLQAERKRKDEEKQFNQEMSYKIRQQKMMSDIYTQQRETAMRNQALDEDKFASDERSGYIEMSPEPNFPALPMLMGGVAGGEKNKDYSLVKPFQEGKFYTPKQGEQQVYDIEGSYKNDKTGTYWTFDKGIGQPRDLGIPFDRNEGRSTTTNITTPTEKTTDYINFNTVEDMIRNYKKRTNKGIPLGDKFVTDDVWRTKANEELDKVMGSAGISQEVFDKVWELSGIKDGDDAIMKRKKLKNVLDQQPNLDDYQKRALYLGVEVRTR